MASSARHTNGDYYSSSTMLSSAGDRTWWGWAKPNAGEYGGGGENIIVGIGTGGGSSEGLLLDVGITNNTTCTAVAFRGGGTDLQSVDFRTGSSTAWFAWFWRIASGSASVEFGWRLEGQTTWTKTTLTLGAVLTMTGGAQYSGSDQFAEHAIDSDTCGFYGQNALLTDGQLLTATQAINASQGGVHSLNEVDAATANVNTGSAGNWTITGTIQTDTTEPVESGPVVSPPAIYRSVQPQANWRRADYANYYRTRFYQSSIPAQVAPAPPTIYGRYYPQSVYTNYRVLPSNVGTQLF